jgi:hypothetical protein
MKLWKFGFIALLLTSSSVSANEQSIVIDKSGVDGITIGMPKKEIDRTRSDITYGGKDVEEYTEGCIEGSVKNKGLEILIEEGLVTRIYIYNSRYVTDKGIKVGSTEQEAIAAYGKLLKSEPHKYDEKGHYLSVIDKNGKGFMFETDGKKIKEVSIGKLPSLEYVEGCF